MVPQQAIQKIELLAPAKDKTCALAAINHGADAVYIGPPKFGARVAAGNSLQDIGHVVQYAHRFGVKIFVTLNTLLTHSELEEAISLVHALYRLGVDALIIQDIRLLTLRKQGVLPPIALHASTQMDNATPQKVLALEQLGLERVVLARELNLAEIAAIRAATTVPLEAFVHGALCVSYSGRCYISEADCGRSANRGACAQYCRLPYDLVDGQGNVLLKGKHLLSLKDMDRSAWLAPMIDAGITSFKIEGRLKEVDYVKNVTAYYRQQLDAVLGRPEYLNKYQQASYGKTTYFFTPNPQKTFHRGATDFFTTDGRFDKPVYQWHTPKSTGEHVGEIRRVFANGPYANGLLVKLTPDVLRSGGLHNGDGLCFTNAQGVFEGLRVNRVDPYQPSDARAKKEADTCVVIFPTAWRRGSHQGTRFAEGIPLFRNADVVFDKTLAGRTAERLIPVDVTLTADGTLTYTDPMGRSASVTLRGDGCAARDAHASTAALTAALSKLGGTAYYVRRLELTPTPYPTFIPASVATAARREALEAMEASAPHPEAGSGTSTPEATSNPANPEATSNASTPGATTAHPIPEGLFPSPRVEDNPLMTCKYCLKNALGFCPKASTGTGTGAGKGAEKGPKIPGPFKEPLYLRYNNKRFRLHFDCAVCRMYVTPAPQ